MSTLTNLERANATADAALVSAGFETDCQALADYAGQMASLTKTNDSFVASFGVLTPAAGATGTVPGVVSTSSAIALNTGQASGYLTAYQNTTPDNPKSGWNGDQGHHVAAFFQTGYIYGALSGSAAAVLLEYWQGLPSGIMNLGDVALGVVASAMGSAVSSGVLKPSQVADAIRGTLCAK